MFSKSKTEAGRALEEVIRILHGLGYGDEFVKSGILAYLTVYPLEKTSEVYFLSPDESKELNSILRPHHGE